MMHQDNSLGLGLGGLISVVFPPVRIPLSGDSCWLSVVYLTQCNGTLSNKLDGGACLVPYGSTELFSSNVQGLAGCVCDVGLNECFGAVGGAGCE